VELPAPAVLPTGGSGDGCAWSWDGVLPGRAVAVKRRRQVEELAAEVLQLPQPGGGHGEPAPAAGGPVEHGPDQR
jgi:hypothetical protein